MTSMLWWEFCKFNQLLTLLLPSCVDKYFSYSHYWKAVMMSKFGEWTPSWAQSLISGYLRMFEMINKNKESRELDAWGATLAFSIQLPNYTLGISYDGVARVSNSGVLNHHAHLPLWISVPAWLETASSFCKYQTRQSSVPQQKGLWRLLSEPGKQRFSAFGPRVAHFHETPASLWKPWDAQACAHSRVLKSFSWPWTGVGGAGGSRQGGAVRLPGARPQPSAVGSHSPAQPLPGA